MSRACHSPRHRRHYLPGFLQSDLWYGALNMGRAFLVAVTIFLVMETASTLAETANEFCANRCQQRCAIKQPAPGLYRGHCMERCVPHCLYNNPKAKKLSN